jgi:hypothetical protein
MLHLFVLASWSGSVKAQDLTRIAIDRSQTALSPVRVKFDLYRDYLIVLPCSSQGVHLNLVLDTGADPSVLDRRAAKRLGLKILSLGRVTTLQGGTPSESAALPQLRLGPLAATNLPVLVQDLSFLQKGLQVGIDGIIGIDVLGRVPFAIDYDTHELSFFPTVKASYSEHLANYTLAKRFPTIEVSLDGSHLRLALDTGASWLMLFSSQVEGRMALITTGAAAHSTNLSGDFYGRKLLIQHPILAGVDFGQRFGIVVTMQKGTVTDFDGLLSPAAFGITKLAFDPERGMISFRFSRALRLDF